MNAPPFAYFGGKGILAPKIAALFPRHDHYVEPYGGSLAVLLAKTPSPLETVNDLDRELMTFWRVLRETPDELARACVLTPHSRAEHVESYHREPGMDDLELARRVWVQLSQGRAGLRRGNGWRHYIKPASNTSMPGYLTGYVERLHECAERLHGVSLECRPAIDLIQRYGREPDVLLYVDPPYLGSTRSSGSYLHEMTSIDDHSALAAALDNCIATVVLSGYHSPLYDDLYCDWHRLEFSTMTGQGGSNQARTEVLWSNRPLGDPVLDFGEETA